MTPPEINDGDGTDLPRANQRRLLIPRAIYIATVALTTLGIIVLGFIVAGLGSASDAGMGLGILLFIAAGYLVVTGLIIFAIPRRLVTVRSVVAVLFSTPAIYLWIALVFWPDS